MANKRLNGLAMMFGQLSGCARRHGQVLLPLIPEKCASMTWVLRRTILAEDVVIVLLHCYCARL